ncbi:prepilin peptidase [Pseudolysinimonas sp.]|uniref:prepilin peptidase n=1 Tax=Pseudolysinimonas sp. TaxID=2680009 RepID=UPI00286CF543|nr:prepilin peptidase [Pseudolysinimonas sp.]
MRRIGWQLPLTLAFGMLAWVAIGPVVAAIPAIYVAAVAPELSRIDLAEHRLPNRLVVPGLVVGLLAAAGSWVTTGNPPVVPLVASAAYGGALLLLALGGGMGMGDVKLATVLGLASPTVTVALTSPLLAFLLGGVVALVVLIVRGRGARIPFGPFLLAGYFGALVVAAVL